MRIVFLGRDNFFDRAIIDDLSHHHDVVGVFFLERSRRSLRARCTRIVCRIKRYGLTKVVDELIFHCFDRLYLRNGEVRFMDSEPEFFARRHALRAPTFQAADINDEEHLQAIKGMQPDIIFSVCCSVTFSPELCGIPTLGLYVLHEGVTPEYRGLHSTLWALMKRDYDCVGCTLLRASARLDDGPVVLQSHYSIGSSEGLRSWAWIAHKAIIAGMPDIKSALDQLEKDKVFEPLDVSDRKGNYHTWMGFSDFIMLWAKNYLFHWCQSTFRRLISFAPKGLAESIRR